MATTKTNFYTKYTLCLSIFCLVSGVVIPFYGAHAESDWIQNCGICHCKWNSGKKTADCRNTSMKAIPSDMSTEMQVIDLSFNDIAEIQKSEFIEKGLEHLHKIYIKNCTLQEINRDAFKDLQVLIELDFSYNNVKILHPGTFHSLKKVRTILMNNNNIEVLEDNLFFNLTFLYKIELKHNRLHRVGLQTFALTPNVMEIYFDSNELSVLNRETFIELNKLKSLSLGGNPWNCTCDLQQFQKFTIEHNLYTPPTSCAAPETLSGKLWSEIPSDMFACAPQIFHPRDGSIVESSTDNVTLSCHIKGSPKPDVQWIFNGRSLNYNDPRIHIRQAQEMNQLDKYISELIIIGIKNSDKGTYTCSAKNKGGSDESKVILQIPLPATDRTAIVTSSSNLLVILCLIAIIVLAILIIVVLAVCCYCRRIKHYSKNGSISENGLVPNKLDKTQQGDSILEGSVIMEMQKSLLTDVNPVEKPPRRTEIDGAHEHIEDGHELKRTLLDETNLGNHDDETHSISLSDTTPRSRATYIDDGYGTNLPPDLIAFQTRFPQSPSLQSSISNIQDGHLYAKSPVASPIYQHNPNLYPGANSGYRTLQLPKGRNMAIINRSNSPFTPAPIMFPVVMKQGYVTIPRKARTPSWTPSLSSNIQDFAPTSPTSTTSTDIVEPVYDNLGLRTTASGNSVLNLNKLAAAAAAQQSNNKYSMKDRPLPATPRTPYDVIPENALAYSMHVSIDMSTTSDTEALFAKLKNNPTIMYGNSNGGPEKVIKIPPRPPPKPKKKPENNASQLFEDECEDGTEV